MFQSKCIWTALLAFTLSGCGGGTTSSDLVPVSSAATVATVATPTPAATMVTLAGTVTDGQVTGATVRVYPVQAGGIIGESRAAAESYPLPAPSPVASVDMGASTSSFSLSVSKDAGPVIVEVTGGYDRDSVDGQTRALPQSTRLRAAVADPRTAGEVHVTPYTTLAAELALAKMRGGTDPGEAIRESNLAIAEHLRLHDMLGTQPRDPRPGKAVGPSVDYGLLIAGVTQEAHMAGTSVYSLMGALARDVRDGRFDGLENGVVVDVEVSGAKKSKRLSSKAMTSDLAAATTTFQNSAANTSGGTVTSSTLSSVAQSSGVVSATPAPYVSPYTITFTVPYTSLSYDFHTSPRGVVALESSNPAFASWYDLSAYPAVIDQEFGPTPARFDAPTPTLPNGVTLQQWQRERIVAVAQQYIAYHYQHHHIPDWDPSPYPDWPWLKVSLGTNSAGIDCSDFSQWYYNFGLGLKLGPASASQDDATNVSLQGGYTEVSSWDGSKVIPVKIPLQLVNGKVPAYDEFAKKLQTGDLLYIRNTKGEISHVIMWLGSIASGGDGTPLILDSHDNAPPIKDSNGVVVPAGVHIRPFRATEWYYQSFKEAHRIIQ